MRRGETYQRSARGSGRRQKSRKHNSVLLSVEEVVVVVTFFIEDWLLEFVPFKIIGLIVYLGSRYCR